jgi:hypothetical protein
MTANELTSLGILQNNYPNNRIIFFEGKFYLL